MTREEEMTNGFAQIVLVQLNTDEQLNVREHEAIRVAIKALEQQTCEDAISREDALMALTGEWTELTDELIHRFIRRIKKLPSVNPQPKIGHWISHYDEDAKEGWYECDRCHTERAFNTDYCPDCGAKMVESQESEVEDGC